MLLHTTSRAMPFKARFGSYSCPSQALQDTKTQQMTSWAFGRRRRLSVLRVGRERRCLALCLWKATSALCFQEADPAGVFEHKTRYQTLVASQRDLHTGGFSPCQDAAACGAECCYQEHIRERNAPREQERSRNGWRRGQPEGGLLV